MIYLCHWYQNVKINQKWTIYFNLPSSRLTIFYIVFKPPFLLRSPVYSGSESMYFFVYTKESVSIRLNLVEVKMIIRTLAANKPQIELHSFHMVQNMDKSTSHICNCTNNMRLATWHLYYQYFQMGNIDISHQIDPKSNHWVEDNAHILASYQRHIL